jgi:hypothetical protein
MARASALPPLVYRSFVNLMNSGLRVAFVHARLSGEVTLNRLYTLPKKAQTLENMWLAVLLANVVTSVSPVYNVFGQASLTTAFLHIKSV